MHYDTSQLDALQLTRLLQAAVAPRPIALVSSLSRDGVPNLAPFSFFGLVSLNPPVVVFSPVSRLRDGSLKHTLHNVEATGECVVHLVEQEQVGQMNLCAVEYEAAVNEFERSGFTPEKALHVRPFLVKECRVKLECRVQLVHSLGKTRGAGSLIIAGVVAIHVDDSLLDKGGKIKAMEYHPVARLGADWYTQVTPASLFEMPKPNKKDCIGMDRLPFFLKNSKQLSANQKASLALLDAHLLEDLASGPVAEIDMKRVVDLIDKGRVDEAWEMLYPATKMKI